MELETGPMFQLWLGDHSTYIIGCYVFVNTRKYVLFKGLVVMQKNHHFSTNLLHNIYRSQKSKYWIEEHCKKAMLLTVVMKMKEM
jgi:hypothetical protein